MMRVLSLLILLLLPTTAVDARQQTFTLTGHIDGLNSTSIRLVIRDDRAPNGLRSETVPVANERFFFTGPIDRLTYVTANLQVDRLTKRVGTNGVVPTSSSQLVFFAFPGAKIAVAGNVSGAFVNAYPSGDRANDDLAALNRQLNPLLDRAADIAVRAATEQDAAAKDAIRKTSEPIEAELKAIRVGFVRAHSSSPASVWLLSDMTQRSQVSDDEAIALFRTLTGRRVGEPFYTSVERRIAGIERSRIGSLVPDVKSRLTPDNSLFDLSTLRGHYVAIDFWGTWCGPCLAETPRVKEYATKYGDKLRVVGIAQDTDVALWKATIARLAMNWPQIRNGKDAEDFVLAMNVAEFPTKILIGPDGKIIARFVGEGDAFFQALDALFGK